MKYKRWTVKEEEYIKENYNVLPIKQIADRLGVTSNQVYAKAQYMRLTREYAVDKKEMLKVKQSDIDELLEWAKDKKGINNTLNLKDKTLLNTLKKYKDNISTSCKPNHKLREY